MSGAFDELALALRRLRDVDAGDFSFTLGDPTGIVQWALRVKTDGNHYRSWGPEQTATQWLDAIANLLAREPNMERYRPDIGATLLRRMTAVVNDRAARIQLEGRARDRERQSALDAEQAAARARRRILAGAGV